MAKKSSDPQADSDDKKPEKSASADASPTKKATAKKSVAKKSATKKTAAKKAPVKKDPVKKGAVEKTSSKQATKASAQKSPASDQSARADGPAESAPQEKAPAVVKNPYNKAFLDKQLQRLRDDRDNLIDQMSGVQREQLRQHDTGAEASGLGDHLADAGNDAYDRDYALSLLSKEQGDLREIDDAIRRVELGTYGICEGSGEVIPKPRLEARPAARYTVQFQSDLERSGGGTRRIGRSTRVVGAEDSAIESMEESVDV